MSEGLSPDVALGVRLSAIMSRARWTRDAGPVLEELYRVAGDRLDVLAMEAGTWAGFYDSPSTHEGRSSQVLVDALRTIPGVEPWIEVGRRRRSAGSHGAPRPGIDTPPRAG
ncbi:hypothetical protein [Microbacterium sp. KNMS]